MKKEKISRYQDTVLRVLANKIDDFYLAGGTALSLFYFQHRLSVDLDFFTPHFSYKRIEEIVRYLEGALVKEIKLIGQTLEKDKARVRIYNIYFTKRDTLKVDFIEDLFKLIKRPKIVDGVKILSLEDIYLRKLYAIAGMIPFQDITGKERFLGGRIEAKDFYDVYFLSSTFMSLSRFAEKYTDNTVKEGLINWFRTYDRMTMMDDLLSLNITEKIDYKSMDKHFNEEIDKIIQRYIERI
ncbi:MAG: nucleotidyl transferase AbiEii/AbiGii toxin family protein [Candidatus Omnitrophica bacterium]|nr:nucleotidyl transferase AbiEii/AbiGii toxin family protein [Candidatus Omnitrophota bacterium]